jgi:hypothetical protein
LSKNAEFSGSSSKKTRLRITCLAFPPASQHAETWLADVRARLDPSRSDVDLQSMEPRTVAVTLAWRHRLRPLNMDLDVFPPVAAPDRLVGLVVSSHGLAFSLRDQRSVDDSSDLRSTQIKGLWSVLP